MGALLDDSTPPVTRKRLREPRDRITITAAYLEGRKAHADGLTLAGNRYTFAERDKWEDWNLGFFDDAHSVPVERRAEVEAIGATWEA